MNVLDYSRYTYIGVNVETKHSSVNTCDVSNVILDPTSYNHQEFPAKNQFGSTAIFSSTTWLHQKYKGAILLLLIISFDVV